MPPSPQRRPDGESGNSPYSKALAETIRKPGSAFSKPSISGACGQTGDRRIAAAWVASSPIDGDFIFQARHNAVAAAPRRRRPTLAVRRKPIGKAPMRLERLPPIRIISGCFRNARLRDWQGQDR